MTTHPTNQKPTALRLGNPRQLRATLAELCPPSLRATDAGCLFALFADAGARLVAPMIIEDLPDRVDEFEKLAFCARLTQVIDHVGAHGLALGVVQADGLDRCELDQWATALAGACEDAGVRDLGVAAVTPTRITCANP